jgi:hypothetical protein
MTPEERAKRCSRDPGQRSLITSEIRAAVEEVEKNESRLAACLSAVHGALLDVGGIGTETPEQYADEIRRRFKEAVEEALSAFFPPGSTSRRLIDEKGADPRKILKYMREDAVEEEREECAKVALGHTCKEPECPCWKRVQDAIRARGKEK